MALLALSLLSIPAPTHAFWPFKTKKFTGNSLIEAGNLGLRGERIVAFGDFNGDQFLDVLMLGSDQKTLYVFLWNHENFEYTSSTTFAHPRKVLNVIPADFTHSGKLDLLVMSEGLTSGTLEMHVYQSLASGGFDVMNPLSIPSSTPSQPITIDLDGDLKIDLMGQTPSPGSGSGSNTFQAWQNVWNSSDPNGQLFSMTTPKFNGAQCALANPHSNAVVDLNGDCLADIFLVCDDGRGGLSYQIWINNKQDGFTLGAQGSLPSGTQTISFADLDRDGTIDLLFATCSSVSSKGVGSDCSINIAYNQQLQVCEYSTDSGYDKDGKRICRPPDNLCSRDDGFKFDFSGEAFTSIPLKSLFPSSPSISLLVRDISISPPLPVSLKVGDANLDGYPDILFIAVDGNNHVPKLAFSTSCTSHSGKNIIPGCATNDHGKRGYEVVTKDVEVLEKIKDARSLSFVDMDEDGTLDIMIQRTGTSNTDKILFVQNNFYYDAFFLKAIVLNGACDNGWCYGPNGTGKYHPFGVSYSGASYKYTVLDTTGKRTAAQVGQLPQTSYHSLQTPYSFFGLGRTNNYIENLFVGSTLHSSSSSSEGHYITMEGVIPNSKVVILPSIKEGVPWKRELFLRPGEWIPWVTAVSVLGTILLGGIVLLLHFNEKREDEMERRRVMHHINFDAL